MHVIKVLGSGCANCKRTTALIESVISDLGTEAEVVKEEDLARIMAYGVMSTPAVVIDEKLVHTGSVPRRSKVEEWLSTF